ncbi:hypothetical protein KEM52_004228 [Ascosphaera acerosa]|nr:hypothetical protein KEM52_004228 [Ascosphaera acerosa]
MQSSPSLDLFETLVFLRFLSALHDVSSQSIAKAAEALQCDEHVQAHRAAAARARHDVQRGAEGSPTDSGHRVGDVSDAALGRLCEDLLQEQASPRQTSASAAPVTGASDAPTSSASGFRGAITAVTARLYSQYRARAIREIRDDEQQYRDLASQIAELERQTEAEEAELPRRQEEELSQPEDEQQHHHAVSPPLREAAIVQSPLVSTTAPLDQLPLAASQAAPSQVSPTVSASAASTETTATQPTPAIAATPAAQASTTEEPRLRSPVSQAAQVPASHADIAASVVNPAAASSVLVTSRTRPASSTAPVEAVKPAADAAIAQPPVPPPSNVPPPVTHEVLFPAQQDAAQAAELLTVAHTAALEPDKTAEELSREAPLDIQTPRGDTVKPQPWTISAPPLPTPTVPVQSPRVPLPPAQTAASPRAPKPQPTPAAPSLIEEAPTSTVHRPTTPHGLEPPPLTTPVVTQPSHILPPPAAQAPVEQSPQKKALPSTVPEPAPLLPEHAPAVLLDHSQEPIASVPSAVPNAESLKQSGAPSGAQLPPSFLDAFKRRPSRLSMQSSGSRTPWKAPSPISTAAIGSPVRPRPEDVSPITKEPTEPLFNTQLVDALEAAVAAADATAASDSKLAATDSGTAARLSAETDAAALSPSPAPSYGRLRQSERSLSRSVSPSHISARTRSRDVSTATAEDGNAADASPEPARKRRRGTVTPRQRSLSVTTAAEESEAERRTSTRLRAARHISEDSLPREQAEPAATTGPKRKREPSVEDVSEDNGQYVHCTRNFTRTSGTIMNDVAAHKCASIFAKPITERDAPGYRDLIYRPQDIKSIKSAIHQGSKAVAAALEAANPEEEPTAGGGLLLKKSADLIPPKSITNSAQLEMELTRMFANAIMFNPTPESAFGRAFPMRREIISRVRKRGRLLESIEEVEVEEHLQEGAIITDTLDMFDDVETAVKRWRAAERAVAGDEAAGALGGSAATPVGGGPTPTLTAVGKLRKPSIAEPAAPGTDEPTGDK